MSFSEGGNLLAVAITGSNIGINVYDVISMQLISFLPFMREVVQIGWDGDILCVNCGVKFYLCKYNS